MNDEQQAALGMFISELERKDVEELETYLIVCYVLGAIAAFVGVGILLLTMFIPTILMFIAAIIILPAAVRASIVTDVMKREIKRIIEEKDDDK